MCCRPRHVIEWYEDQHRNRSASFFDYKPDHCHSTDPEVMTSLAICSDRCAQMGSPVKLARSPLDCTKGISAYSEKGIGASPKSSWKG